MAIATWPAALPPPERDTWNFTRQDGRLRSQRDAGPPRYRRRFSATGRLVSLSMVVSRDGKAIFDRFYDVITAGGSTLFWMPDPTTDGWGLLTETPEFILTGDGLPILLGERWLCSFGDQVPSDTVLGIDFRISFSLVVMP